MKKSKKLGLQSLALVLMSLVLVAGVAFGMTGAWFQDSASVDNSNIVMGHEVTITLNNATGAAYAGIQHKSGDGTLEAAMPGDVYTFDGLRVDVPANQSAMYVIIKVSNNASEIFAGDLLLDLNWLEFTDDSMADYRYQEVAASDSEQVLAIYGAQDLEVSRALNNDHADKEVEISGAAYAIQQANIVAEGKTFEGLTLTELNALFAETTGNDIVLA